MRVSEGIITTGLSDWFATSGSPPRTAPSGQGASGWCGHDLVVVANRLPVHIAPSEPVRWRPSPGGLVSALEPVVREIGGVWVGWSGSNHPRTEPFDAGGLHLMPVPLTARDIAEFYDGFCNATLWPLPIAPKMNTRLRPTRSDRIAQAGSAASATTLVTIATHSIVVRSRPLVSTAKLSA